MKKPLLSAAAVGMLSAVALSPASAVVIDLGVDDYNSFVILDATPDPFNGFNLTNSTMLFHDGTGQISVIWNTSDPGPYSVFWGTTTTLDDIEFISTTGVNSSSTPTTPDINFGLFVEVGDTFYMGDSVKAVGDNESFSLELDVTSLATDYGFDVADIEAYGLYVGSEITSMAHARVPEPSTLATLGAGLLAFGAMAARRRKEAQAAA